MRSRGERFVGWWSRASGSEVRPTLGSEVRPRAGDDGLLVLVAEGSVDWGLRCARGTGLRRARWPPEISGLRCARMLLEISGLRCARDGGMVVQVALRHGEDGT